MMSFIRFPYTNFQLFLRYLDLFENFYMFTPIFNSGSFTHFESVINASAVNRSRGLILSKSILTINLLHTGCPKFDN